MAPFASPAVEERFANYPEAARPRLLEMREIILDVARKTEGVGELEETLKWGQPSYLTAATKSGTTVRIDAHLDGGAALLVNCQTDLVEEFRRHYPALLYEGARCVRFPDEQPLPEAPLRHIIALTLTYHARKWKRSGAGNIAADDHPSGS
ncbi:MAG TPA: DUF1801 domain-containing protein [Devosiaceae bacterium]|jgi:hypothetical protein|nr:DUF1801 domain-containing protein [Devosiaceae bacterium]